MEYNLEWPELGRPPPKYWQEYRHCTRQAFATRQATRLSQQVFLDHPLGEWLPVKCHIRYPFYHTHTEVFNQNGTNFLAYNEPTNVGLFLAHGKVDELPLDAHPVTAGFDEDCLWTSQPCNLRSGPHPPPQSANHSTTATARPYMSGSDGPVDIVSGDRACSYAVSLDGTPYSGSKRFPSLKYATSYGSEC